MTVRKFEYLVALAREGHFARAAAACHVSQPTLSTALRQLEAEMGATIIKRGQRYSGLTAQGERVLAFARRMLTEFQQLRSELEGRGNESLGTLRVGVIPSAIPVASAHIAMFHKNYRHVNVTLTELNPGDIQAAFADFSIEVAVSYIGKDLRKQLRSHALYAEQYCLLVHRSNPLCERGTVSWEEARQLNLCLLAKEMLAEPLQELLESDSRGTARFETNSFSALSSQVRTGAWAALLPQSLCKDLQATGDVESISLPPLPNPVKVGVVIPDREFAVPLAESFFASIGKRNDPVRPVVKAGNGPVAVAMNPPRTLSGWRSADPPIRTSN